MGFKDFFKRKINIEEEAKEITEETEHIGNVEEGNKEEEESLIVVEEEQKNEESVKAGEVEETNRNREEETEEKKGYFAKIVKSLTKTRENILSSVDNVLKNFKGVDEELFEELEEVLITADIGVETSLLIINRLRDQIKKEKIKEAYEVKACLVDEIKKILEENDEELELKSPTIILMVGVNGVGKTTTIGKLTNNLIKEKKSVLLVAADTFRAAAIDQLQIWGDRNNVTVIKHQEGSDPGAVVYDGVAAAKARKTDVLICDTAGRLHNKKNLMEELGKIYRIVSKNYEDANLEVFLVLDATTGQNALQQAKLFKEVANITGIILTKLEGTAKGGIVIAIKNELKIPVRYIGIGEGVEDLQKFDTNAFSRGILGENIE